MPSLEHVVRPFQTGAVAPPRRMLPGVAGTPMPGDAPPDNVSLTPGKDGGSAKTLWYSASVQQTFYLDRRHKEKQPDVDAEFSRDMVIQRVRNPKDKSQYVDVASTRKLTTQKGRGQTFRRDIGEYFGLDLGDPDQRSALFTVRNRADLQGAAEEFAAEHEADEED
jgi:hypothetical protein